MHISSNQEGLTWYQFDEINAFPFVTHGIFSRKGGVSSAPFETLNLGGNIGDDQQNIKENRSRIFRALNRPESSLFDVWQVHGTDVVSSVQPRPLTEPHRKADGILTDNPEVTLLMRFADCVPILLVDPERKAVGLVHAGWQGTVKNIAAKAVDAMTKTYGSLPSQLIAGIGPSIGPDHYIVRKDVYEIGKDTFKTEEESIFQVSGDQIHFNLWKANEYLLRTAGVVKILNSNLCTACDPSNWFSHRAEGGATGRFAGVIALRERE